MGGFQCIPELFRTYDTLKLTQPDDRDHFKPNITGFEFVKLKNVWMGISHYSGTQFILF